MVVIRKQQKQKQLQHQCWIHATRWSKCVSCMAILFLSREL